MRKLFPSCCSASSRALLRACCSEVVVVSLGATTVSVLGHRRHYLHGRRTISEPLVLRQSTKPKQASSAVLRLTVMKRCARNSASHSLPTASCTSPLLAMLLPFVGNHFACTQGPPSALASFTSSCLLCSFTKRSSPSRPFSTFNGPRNVLVTVSFTCLASSLLSTAGWSPPRSYLCSGWKFFSLRDTLKHHRSVHFTRPMLSHSTNKPPISLNLIDSCSLSSHNSLVR